MSAGVPVGELSKRLLEAARTRTPIPPLTDEHPGLTEEDAYEVQEALVAAMGGAPVGYKLGFTSRAMREQMGVAGPNHGRLLEDMRVQDGGTVPLSGLIHPRVEPEIALLVEEDLSGPGLRPAQVRPAVRWAFGALEIVDSRFRDYKFRAEDNTADNSSAARFVPGTPVAVSGVLDLRPVEVSLRKDGRTVDSGVGANAMGDPISTVAWLANRLGEAGGALEGGSIVLTGGLTRAYPVGAGGEFAAEFAGLGTVRLCFEEG